VPLFLKRQCDRTLPQGPGGRRRAAGWAAGWACAPGRGGADRRGVGPGGGAGRAAGGPAARVRGAGGAGAAGGAAGRGVGRRPRLAAWPGAHGHGGDKSDCHVRKNSY
jgi:hypothetical protein